jgi:hypothetical protein
MTHIELGFAPGVEDYRAGTRRVVQPPCQILGDYPSDLGELVGRAALEHLEREGTPSRHQNHGTYESGDHEDNDEDAE